MKKRIFAVAMAVSVMAATLAGCGGGGSESTTAAATTAAATTAEATTAAPETTTAAETKAPETTAAATEAASETNWPEYDITLTVAWNPGGVTDLTVRAYADVLSKELGKNITIANTAGASGSVGTIAVWDAPRDGYNLLGASMQATVTFPCYGYTDFTTRDWDIWTMAYAPNVVVVPGNSPYNTLEELIEGAKAETLDFGSAGAGSGGHTGIEILSKGAGFEYNHVPYDSGANCIVATISGEVDANCQLITEVIDYVASGDLKCLGVMAPEDLVVGDITIPSVLKTVPEMENVVPMGETITLAVPNGVDEAILKKLDEVMPKVAASEEFQSFCESKGMVVVYNDREASQEYVNKLASLVDWTLYDGGTVTISPEEFGIERIK